MSTSSDADKLPTRLLSAWDAGKREGKRQRDVADALGVSEAELVSSACGDFVTRLSGDFRDLLLSLPQLGPVMALTRNDSCVHEKTGTYENLSFEGHVGLALGGDIDLRLFMSKWKTGYALREMTKHGIRASLQFFDPSGKAVHKIFLEPASNQGGFDSLVSAFTDSDQGHEQPVNVAGDRARADCGEDIERDAFLHAWSRMRDTHEFFGMLRRFRLARREALTLAQNVYTRALGPDCARAVLERAAESGLPIMIFVGNPGCTQIHTGSVANIQVMREWLNVLDPGFSLHLRETDIDRAWAVVKPTADGDVTSVELFDRRGEVIAMLFGKRKPGVPELAEWRALVEGLDSRVLS